VFTPKRTSRIGNQQTAVLLGCSALAVTACGGSSKTNRTSSSTPGTPTSGTTTPAGRASGPPPPALAKALASVRGRTLTAGELAGFTPGQRALGQSAKQWESEVDFQAPASEQASTAARLQRLGFVKGLREALSANGGAPGLSFVEQFRTPAGARAELAAEVRAAISTSGPSPAKPFAVRGIPGASGFGDSSSANVAFAKGSYVYLVGAVAAPGTSSAKTQAKVIAAAQHLYHRVT
jgi:hypothetical protein